MLTPAFFRPHPNLSDEINDNIVRSEVEGGVQLQDLEPGSRLQIHTQHTYYDVLVLSGSTAMISGHPLYCPDPVQVTIAGSTWGGSMLKLRYIGRGMHLEFHHPEYDVPIVTSAIQEIQESSGTAGGRDVRLSTPFSA
jgi:hypothetical protein